MLYFITGSKNKFDEVKVILPDIEQMDIDLPEIQEINAREIIKAKIIEASKHHNGEFMVEDTGLYLAGLNGLPGPFIKWFMKTIGNDGLYSLAEKLDNSDVEARTVIGYGNGETMEFFEGVARGKIVAPRGESNFGWDPIFQPEGYNLTFAQMPKEEKNKISMRRLAAEKLHDYLKRA